MFNTWVGLCQCFLSTVLLSSASVTLCTNFDNNNNNNNNNNMKETDQDEASETGS